MANIKRQEKALVVFSLLFFAFTILFPTLLTSRPSFFPVVQWADLVDLFTPFVLMASYWRLFSITPAQVGRRQKACLLVFACLWIEGHGVHLASNSIGNLLTEKRGDVFKLAYFFDERLSHCLWMLGIVGVWGVLYSRQNAGALREQRQKFNVGLSVLIGALLHGASFFMIAVEGQTSLIAIPAALLGVILPLKEKSGPNSAPSG